MKYIYKVSSPNSNNVYIGKCGNSLNARLCQHRYYYKMYCVNDKNRFYSSAWIFIDGDAKIESLELCEDHLAGKRESYWIHQSAIDGYNVVNIRDGVINKEKKLKRWLKYYYEHREEKIERAKKYYQDNKEKCQAYQKEYYKNKKLKLNGPQSSQSMNSPEC